MLAMAILCVGLDLTKGRQLWLGTFLFPDRDVSIDLICNHFPAACQAGQDRGFGSALRQKHEAVTFVSLVSAPIRLVHDYA
jgi:hypothetical protein